MGISDSFDVNLDKMLAVTSYQLIPFTNRARLYSGARSLKLQALTSESQALCITIPKWLLSLAL